jgi:hypothetical protein
MIRSTVCRAALPVLLVSAGAAVARAEVTDCTAITAVPTTIGAPGVYCLTGNLLMTGSGAAIHVDGPKDVLLDLNGHTLAGPGSGTAVLVEAASRVTVRNGSIVSFQRAVSVLADGFNARIEDLFVSATGDQPAIESQGFGAVVQRNWIERGNPVIRVGGGNARVTDNDVVNALSGIDMAGASGFIEDNRVTRAANGTGYGIRASGGRTFVSRNEVQGFATCFDLSTTARYRENVTISCNTTYTGGVSAGSNY